MLIDARKLMMDRRSCCDVVDFRQLSKQISFDMLNLMAGRGHGWSTEVEVWDAQLKVRYVDGHPLARKLVHPE